MQNKISHQPEWDALHKFDADNNVEPARVIAYRIASKYGHSATGRLVDEISGAIEDAMELGQRRGLLIPPVSNGERGSAT